MALKLSPDQVSIVMDALPPAAQQPGSGVAYADGELHVPEEWAALASAVDTSGAALKTAKASKDSVINDKRDAVVTAGFRYDFGAAGGVRILDQRDARDETAWLVVDREASKLPPDTPFPLRDASNDTFVTTAGAAVEAMGAMARWRMAVSKHSWDLKDAVAAAKTVAALDKINTNDGWPA